MLRLANISKSLRGPDGATPILHNIDFEVAPGESVAVLGRSGAGKSTFLSILGLLERPDEGSYLYQESETTQMSDSRLSVLRGQHIGFVFQRYLLLGHLSALENVSLALQHGRHPRRGRRDSAREALSAVGLDNRRDNKPRQLSGGEQQRVAIARAIVRRPSLLLADEPTGAIDESTSEDIIDLMLGIAQDRAAAIVTVTHDQAVASRFDRLLHLVNGRWTS